VLILLAGLSYFSSSITEEKEEQTLGLMLLTGLSPLGILLGKSTSRLIQAGWLVILQIPFVLLSVTLGGVTLAQVLAAWSMLLALLWFVAHLGLLCSVIARRSSGAGGLMLLASLGYCGLAWVLAMIAYGQALGTTSRSPVAVLVTQLLEGLIFLRSAQVLQSSYSGPVVTTMEVLHLVAGGVCFLLAWLLFSRVARNADLVTESRPVALWPVWSRRSQSKPSSQRAERPPLLWKDRQLLLGGWPGQLTRLVAYLTLVGVVFLWWYVANRWHLAQPWFRIASQISIVLVFWGLVLDAAHLFSRLYSEEVRLQTWSSLVILPYSITDLILSKLHAAVWGLLPGGTVLLGLMVGSEAGHDLWRDISKELGFWLFVAVIVTGLQFAAFWSLFVRWGAVPLAAGTVILPFFVIIPVLSAARISRNDADVLSVMGIIGLAVTVAVLQAVIAARLRVLAAQ
jgi:hypothetical protein